MKLVQISCPNCNGSLTVDENSRIVNCQYCGAQLFLDDGTVRVEKTIRYYDEARIREAETKRDLGYRKILSEENENDRSLVFLVKYVLLMMVMSLVISVGMWGWEQFNDTKAKIMQTRGWVSVGDSEDIEGVKYKGIVKRLKKLGFTDIQLVDLHDAGILKNHNSTIERITINGDSHFSENDYFDPSSKVVITYH